MRQPQLRASSTTLGKELELCEPYLSILRTRIGSRLSFAIDVGGPLGGTPVLACCGTTCVDLCSDGANCAGCANSCGAPPFNICLGGSCFSGDPTYDGGVPMGCTGLPIP